MNGMNTRRMGAAVALMMSAVAVAPLTAQDLPAARSLVDRHIEAVGGRDAVLQSGAYRATGSFQMPAAGLNGQMVIVSETPNRMATRVTIDGLGEIVSGTDGKVAWSMDPMSGPRLLEGAELRAMLDGANMLAAVRDPSLVESMQTVERTEMRGQACLKVKVVWKSGRESSDCYSVDSGLLIATSATQESPMGSMEVVTHLSDYKQMGGVLMPSKMTQSVMGMEQVMTIDSVERGEAGRWPIEPPAAIRTMIDA